MPIINNTSLLFGCSLRKLIIRLEISNITNNSAKVSWTPVGTETAWNLEWGTSAFVQGNGTLVPITNANYTITSLDSNTIYDVYVQADCGSSTTSDWIGSTFTTTGNNSVGLFDESNSNQNIFHLYLLKMMKLW